MCTPDIPCYWKLFVCRAFTLGLHKTEAQGSACYKASLILMRWKHGYGMNEWAALGIGCVPLFYGFEWLRFASSACLVFPSLCGDSPKMRRSAG
jgi:hypothetical protein